MTRNKSGTINREQNSCVNIECESPGAGARRAKPVMTLHNKPIKKSVVKYSDEYKVSELYCKIDPLPPVPVHYLLKHLSMLAYSPRGFHA